MNCPNCAAPLDVHFAAAKMTTCGSCGTTVYLQGKHLVDAGTSGEMHDAPMLFTVGDRVETGQEVLTIYGHARFDYGRGWWDEFFATTASGSEVWISVDEGDVILQNPISQGGPRAKTPPKLGKILTFQGERYLVTETGDATCLSTRGSFPEILYVGTEYSYVNCSGDSGKLLSGEFSAGEVDWYIGRWLDPFEIKVERGS